MKTQKELIEIATEINPYKESAPYGEETRGFKLGVPAGYMLRVNEELEGRISDEELLAKFQEAVRQPNMIVGDAALCVKIAKEYADNVK